MPKHQRQVFDYGLSRRAAHAWRAAGWILLGLAIVSCVTNHGASIGTVVWIGLLTVAGVLVTMLLTYLPHALAILVVVAPLIAVLLLPVSRVVV